MLISLVEASTFDELLRFPLELNLGELHRLICSAPLIQCQRFSALSKMELTSVCKIGYLVVLGTYILMIWVSLSGAREPELVKHPPCYFNPLCSCSKGMPELGIVQCQDVHLPRIPEMINISKVFILHLDNNHLPSLEPHFLQSTGLYKIRISRNPLAMVPDEAFMGLERSLWELELSHNNLAHVPSRAFRYLQKLRLLDLTGNDIVEFSPESWRGLENSLITLILSDNAITTLQTDSFSGLPMLETLDLRGNNLKDIDPTVFRDGMDRLTNIILADNQLTAIPYQALSYLKQLRNLDLSHNRINKMFPASEVGVQNVNYNFLFNLDTLGLEYNEISLLERVSFEYFGTVNKTLLNGNPIIELDENAFRNAKIRELYLRNCKLKQVHPEAFSGLETNLEILDLAGNDIVSLPEALFQKLTFLKTILLEDNLLTKLDVSLAFNGLQFALNKLDLAGNEKLIITINLFKKLKNLRSLSVSRLATDALSPEDFEGFGVDIEELKITLSNLQTIKDNAFRNLHGLKRIYLGDNSIKNIESNAFADVSHSLKSLVLPYGLSSSVNTLPSSAFKDLHNLEELDFSNNRLKTVPDTSFHFLKHLKYLNLQDNMIEIINKGTFQGDIHRNLNHIFLSCNYIRQIQQHTFSDLVALEELQLDDNRIDSLQKRSFTNLENLKALNLRGNKIKSISSETFQNLPQLELLDLSYNQIGSLDFGIFDQVGTLASFCVNMSHNSLVNLNGSASLDFHLETGIGGIHSNIRTLDLSYNNITSISKQFFRPIELSLGHLDISHNQILNATREVFGNMPHLQFLDLSHNSIYELDFDSFRNTRHLQIFAISNNRIVELPNDLFRFLSNLRVVKFSHNRLRFLPDNLFREPGLESLDLSHNFLGKMPLTSLSVASALTLTELDVSWNGISSISGGLLSKFKSLASIDLSYNRLGQIDGGTFNGMPKLTTLNLGHNIQLTLDENGLSFQGLEYTLQHLNLDNVSLSQVPTLLTHNLVTLSIANNLLSTVATDIVGNMSTLRSINLNDNDLSVVPIVIHSMVELRYLSIAGNPLTTLSNTSFLGVANQLKVLDIENIALTTLETGVFCKMQSLRVLKMDLYNAVKNLNVPRLIYYCKALKVLELNIQKDIDNVEGKLTGELPCKLRNVTIIGPGFKKIDSKMFQGIMSSAFHVTIRNTSVTKITTDVFKQMGSVKNISIDLRGNAQLKSLFNPSTGNKVNLPRSTFLVDLKLSGSQWTCDCDLGWVEVWQRKKRQYLCNNLDQQPSDVCNEMDQDLRQTTCQNKNNQSLLEVLKTDIECGWGSATSLESILRLVLLVQVLVLFLF